MKIIIHRGTHQIGGCITEIQSKKGTRIAIDIGENLPSTEGKTKLEIEGLTKAGEKNFDAVFVTHYHGDHIGMFNKVLEGIPIYVGEISKEIYQILEKHLAKAEIVAEDELKRIEEFRTYSIKKKVTIKDIVITPIEVDHSAFNAHMLLVECDGKKVLHTGDFRLHGQRGKAVIPTLEKYVGEVDALICEGTTLSRTKKEPMTERELQMRAEKIFQENPYTFVMCSSTNIDRIAAIHKAALKANRLVICDKYQKEMLLYIDSIARSSLYQFKGKILSYDNNIVNLMRQRGFVMFVRANNGMAKRAMKQFPNHTFVYSQWEGYLSEKDKEEYAGIQKFVPASYIYLHTSGHASFEAIQKVGEVVKPKILVPIHSENPKAFENLRT